MRRVFCVQHMLSSRVIIDLLSFFINILYWLLFLDFFFFVVKVLAIFVYDFL